MERRLLDLKPKRFLCPYCGEWHDWDKEKALGYYDSNSYKAIFVCSDTPVGCNKGNYRVFFEDGYCYYITAEKCIRAGLNLNGKIAIADITESIDEPIVTFKVPFKPYSSVGSERCKDCKEVDVCNVVKLADKGYYPNMEITLGFEFEQFEYEKYANAGALVRRNRELKERESALKSKEEEFESKQQAKEEEKLMAEGTKMSLKKRLYECSPKENLEVVKQWAEKYKPVLKWAIPVAAIYGAYRILNSDEFDLSVNNIAETCEKRLGFKIDFLENKKALKELMALGGISAGAYGAMKAVSTIFNAKNEEEISMEDVENGMEKLDTISQKFAWLQPKTEAMLPIALSVIMVYVTLHKPKFTGKFANKVRDLTEDIQVKISTYLDLAKLFIADKLNIDLSDEKEQQKLKICIFLCALVGISIFLYGKKVLGSKQATEQQEEEAKKPVEAFVEQAKAIIEKIAPTVYTTLITFLVSKKLLAAEEALKVVENTEEADTMPAEVVEGTTIEEQAEVAESDATEEQEAQETVHNTDE